MNVSDNLTWYQEEWGGGCHSLLPCTSKGCFRTGVPCYCLLWCDFVTFAIFNRRGSSSWKTTLWTSWSIWAGFVRLSIHNQVFFFLIKTHRERGSSNPSSGPLPFSFSHFCDKMFNVFLKKRGFFFGLVRGRPFVRLNRQTVVVVFFLYSYIVKIFTVVAHAQFSHLFSWLYSSLILNWSNLLNFMVVITRSPPYL